MGINFQFATATRIIFENDSFKNVPDLAAELGDNVFIVSGKRTILANRLLEWLKEKNIKSEVFSINSEPTTQDIEFGTELVRKNNCKVE